MRKGLVLTALLAPALWGSFARAADPTLVAGVGKYLQDDEKAMLAAILTHPDVSAQFDAQAPLALKDPKNLAPFLGVWRAKMEAFAETDAKLPDPDLKKSYDNYAQMMTAEQQAYLMSRVPTMPDDLKNKLIGALNNVNDDLAELKKGDASWLSTTADHIYINNAVPKIMDAYRQQMTAYVATPLAQTAKRDAAASAASLAALQTAVAPPTVATAQPVPATAPTTVPSPKPAAPPVPQPAPTTPPTPPATPNVPGTTTSHSPAGGALDQLTKTAGSGAQGGQNFDGGAGAKPATGGDAVVVPAPGGGSAPTLTPSTGGLGKPNLIATVPSPSSDASNFMASISKMQTKPAEKPLSQRLLPLIPKLAAGLGAIIGGVLGFLLGGPVGAVAGLAIGAGLGYLGGTALLKHLSH